MAGGDIHIWDRDTARKLYTIENGTQPLAASLTCLAWNSGLSHLFMLATGSTDGTVSIWSTLQMSDRAKGTNEDRAHGLDLSSLLRIFQKGRIVATIPSMASTPVWATSSRTFETSTSPVTPSGILEEIPPDMHVSDPEPMTSYNGTMGVDSAEQIDTN